MMNCTVRSLQRCGLQSQWPFLQGLRCFVLFFRFLCFLALVTGMIDGAHTTGWFRLVQVGSGGQKSSCGFVFHWSVTEAEVWRDLDCVCFLNMAGQIGRKCSKM